MPLALAFIAVVCAFVWIAPKELTQTILALIWVLMAAAAIVLPILALAGVI